MQRGALRTNRIVLAIAEGGIAVALAATARLAAAMPPTPPSRGTGQIRTDHLFTMVS